MASSNNLTIGNGIVLASQNGRDALQQLLRSSAEHPSVLLLQETLTIARIATPADVRLEQPPSSKRLLQCQIR
ncbi:hypothetical protein HPB50_029354 [Hyalomma asiaticum]|nr:hypothetical protein HPB50_029354 [Hyalomma asiaticum]